MNPILVVDDVRYSLIILAKTLEKEGYAVETASDPAQALELLKKHDFSLVVTDLNMPGMDGKEFFAAAKNTQSTADGLPFHCPPFILLSAFSERTEKDLEGLASLGFADIILKPVDRERLGESIRKILDQDAGGAGASAAGAKGLTLDAIVAYLEERDPGARKRILDLARSGRTDPPVSDTGSEGV